MTDKEFIAATRRYGLRPYRIVSGQLRAEIPYDSCFYVRYEHPLGLFLGCYRGRDNIRTYQYHKDLTKAVASLWKGYWQYKTYPAARNFIREMEL